MKPAPFAFVRPQGLQHALEALAADPGAKVLAGGQSLVPLLSMRLAAPSTLVDINALPGPRPGAGRRAAVRVGALARHADVLASPDVRRVQPLVPLALAHVAHATIRNRGTAVGSLVHADAAAEMPVVLACSAARSTSRRCAARARSAAADLFAGPLESTLRHDEIALAGVLPGAGAGGGRRLRGDRPAARRLRPVRRGRRRRGPTVSGWSRPGPATSRSPTCRPSST